MRADSCRLIRFIDRFIFIYSSYMTFLTPDPSPTSRDLVPVVSPITSVVVAKSFCSRSLQLYGFTTRSVSGNILLRCIFLSKTAERNMMKFFPSWSCAESISDPECRPLAGPIWAERDRTKGYSFRRYLVKWYDYRTGSWRSGRRAHLHQL
jgi:hypothetical protein